MKFYRNLGPIRFQGQTETFEVFSAEPSTFLFQPKQTSTQSNIFQEIATFYKGYMHSDNFQTYQQTDKAVSLVISNCKKQHLSQMDCNSLCNWMLQAAKIVEKVSEIVPETIGDFSALQFFTLANRKLFFYVPTHKTKDNQQRQRLQIQGLTKLTNCLKTEKDMSQHLLAKKLGKCKSLQQLIQELTYFSNIYGYGVNKKYEKLMKLQQSTLGKRNNKNDKSKRKFNLFQLDPRKAKPTFYSYHENNYVSSEPRKSCTAIHISLPDQKKVTNSLHTSSHRQLRPFSSVRRASKNHQSVDNMKNSKLKESNISKDKQRLSKKTITKQLLQNYSVNRKDQQKLLKRLQNRKKEDSKLQQIDFTKSVGIQLKASDEFQTKEQPRISQIQPVSLINPISNEISSKQLNQAQINEQKPHSKPKQQIKQKRESISVSTKQTAKQATKHLIKHESPRINKSKKTIVNQLSMSLAPTKSTPKKQQPLPAPPLIQSSITTKPSTQPQKKLKKKKIPYKPEDTTNSQLQVIELEAKSKPIKLQQNPKPNQQIFNQTRKNSVNQQFASQMQQTKRVYQKQPTLQQKLNQRLKNVDMMGTAVANTIGHLVGYEKIFWQLPMFFIYRAFYLERVEILEKLERLPYGNSPLQQIKDQNAKIFESVTKLTKIITKKLKKEDASLLSSVKSYLNLDPKIDCNEAMKLFLKEYIESLEQAIKSKYSQLTLHLLQIIDGYLVYFGHSLDFSARSKAQKGKEEMNFYLAKQLKALKGYY